MLTPVEVMGSLDRSGHRGGNGVIEETIDAAAADAKNEEVENKNNSEEGIALGESKEGLGHTASVEGENEGQENEPCLSMTDAFMHEATPVVGTENEFEDRNAMEEELEQNKCSNTNDDENMSPTTSGGHKEQAEGELENGRKLLDGLHISGNNNNSSENSNNENFNNNNNNNNNNNAAEAMSLSPDGGDNSDSSNKNNTFACTSEGENSDGNLNNGGATLAPTHSSPIVSSSASTAASSAASSSHENCNGANAGKASPEKHNHNSGPLPPANEEKHHGAADPWDLLSIPSKTHDGDVPGIARQRSAPTPSSPGDFGDDLPPHPSAPVPRKIVDDPLDDRYKSLSYETGKLLVVLDMDHTLVGDLESLSDRDNVETNLPWTFWPPGVVRGLAVKDIVPFLERGMLRPGVAEFLTTIRKLGGTIVIYTHSEEKWARKVVESIEAYLGFPFAHRIFSRLDCKDGNPYFASRKSLRYVVKQLQSGFSLQKVLFLDDDATAVGGEESSRLIVVPSYDYWEPCKWDENLTADVLSKNPPELVNKLVTAVREWGIASPIFGKKTATTDEDERVHKRWEVSQKNKLEIRMMFNKMLDKDCVFRRLRDVIESEFAADEPDVARLPAALREAIGNAQPPTRSSSTQ